MSSTTKKGARKKGVGNKQARASKKVSIGEDIVRKVLIDVISKAIVFGMGAALPAVVDLLARLQTFEPSNQLGEDPDRREAWLASVIILIGEIAVERQRIIESAVAVGLDMNVLATEIGAVLRQAFDTMRPVDFAEVVSISEKCCFRQHLVATLPEATGRDILRAKL